MKCADLHRKNYDSIPPSHVGQVPKMFARNCMKWADPSRKTISNPNPMGMRVEIEQWGLEHDFSVLICIFYTMYSKKYFAS